MRLVLDASVALAWLFERQHPDEAELATQVLGALPNVEASVPALWHAEIVNALLVGERRRVVAEAWTVDYLTRLSRLPISTDDRVAASRREPVLALSREHGLTACDATYLDLALRTDAKLATFDTKLVDAMRRTGGALLATA